MDIAQVGTSSGNSSDVRRPDKVRPYMVNFWADIVDDDTTSEILNILGMMLSMLGIIMKYKFCAWCGLLISAVSFANIRANYDSKQVMSSFMLSFSSLVMSYLTNAQPIALYLSQSSVVASATTGAGSVGAATQSAPLDTVGSI